MNSKFVHSFDYAAIALNYINSAILLGKDGVIYVEGEVDIFYWQSIFEHFLPDNKTFEFYCRSNALTTSSIAHSGSGECYKFANYTESRFLICIDSDYHNIFSTLPIIKNDFIFETYTYSFENHLCFPSNIIQLINYINSETTATMDDIKDFINQLTPLCFELIANSIVSEELLSDGRFFRYELDSIFRIDNTNLSLNDIIASIRTKINNKIISLAYNSADIEVAKNLLQNINITQQNAYLYVKGHAFYDNCIKKLITKKFELYLKIKMKKLPNYEKGVFYNEFLSRQTPKEIVKQRVFNGYREIEKIGTDINRYIISYLT